LTKLYERKQLYSGTSEEGESENENEDGEWGVGRGSKDTIAKTKAEAQQ
jgi:hypothetical protein